MEGSKAVRFTSFSDECQKPISVKYKRLKGENQLIIFQKFNY